jgi:hypothetical protein
LARFAASGPAIPLFLDQLASSLALLTAESSQPLLDLLERCYPSQVAFIASQLFALPHLREPSRPGSVALSRGIRWSVNGMDAFVRAFHLGVFSHLRRFSLFTPTLPTVADHARFDICKNSLLARVIIVKRIWVKNGT